MSAQTPSTDPKPVDQATLKEPQPGFGWTQYAEQTNGRFAMVGFIALLLLELFTKQDFFTWIGLR
ncbi:MAG: chlorophyll a/b-binding protein [Phormidesmis sp.]